MAADELGRASIPIRATLDQLAADLERARVKITGESAKIGDQAAKSITDRLDAAGKKMSGIGKKMSLGLTAPILAFGAGALKASNDFNAGMANVASLIPGNTKRVGELKDGVQDLAVEVGKSTGDLSDGLYNVISAFGDTSDSMKILDINARAATAGVATTTDAINLTSAVTKGYGDTSAKAVSQASDLALMTVKLGQTTFPELAASIGQVIPFTTQLGISQQELFASMATLTGVTGGASEVATQMKGAMQALMAPTADAAKAFKAAGYESGAAAVKQLGLQGSMKLLTDAAAKSGKPLQAYVSSLEGQTFALSLTGSQAKNYTDKLGEMSKAAGVTDAAFAEQTQGINKTGFALAQAKEKGQVFAQNMGDALAPALMAAMDAAEPLIRGLQRMMAWFQQLSPGMQSVVLALVGIVAAAGPMLVMVGKIAQGIAAVTKVVQLMNLAFLANPWTLVIAAVVAAVVLIVTHWEQVKAALGAIWEAIKGAAVAAWNWIKDNIKTIVEALVILVTGPIGLLAVLIYENWEKIKAAALAAWTWIKDHISQILQALLVVLTGGFGALVLLVVHNWDRIKGATSAAWEAVKSAVSGAIGAVVGFVAGLPGRVAGALASLAGTLSRITRSAFAGMTSAVLDGISDIVGWVASIPGRIWSALGDTARMLFQAGVNIVKGLIDGMMSMIGKVGDAIGSVVGKIRDHLPWSPAKEGPLSGRGYPLYSGQKIGGALADGILGSTGRVAAASLALAAAASAPISGGLTVGVAGRIAASTPAEASALSMAGVEQRLEALMVEQARTREVLRAMPRDYMVGQRQGVQPWRV